LFRARGIKTPGMSVYHPQQRERWLAQLTESGARVRAETLYAQLGVLRALRPRVKAAMVQEAQRDPAWSVLRSIPYFGPVRIALLFATLQTPWRFRTKRHLWAYAGLAVVSRTSAEYEIADDRPVRRRRRWVQTRGLNRNHNPVVKDVFKSAATTAATRSGALQDWYERIRARGLSADLARVTLARKLAALTLHLWKTGAHYDPTQLSVQAH
jgi:transposase